MAINTMKSIVQMRKDRVGLERQALTLFRMLLKVERGRKSRVLTHMSPKVRDGATQRVKALDAQILQIRREIRKMSGGR